MIKTALRCKILNSTTASHHHQIFTAAKIKLPIKRSLTRINLLHMRILLLCSYIDIVVKKFLLPEIQNR